MALTDRVIKNCKPTDKPIKLFDERGLFLLVVPSGGKWWRFRYRLSGREKSLSMGLYPDVSLADARELRDQARKLLVDGIDPSENRKMEKAARRAEQAGLIGETRFMLDNDGALSFRLGERRVVLTPGETTELRAFLDATRAVIPKVTSCP
jgi:hypothetical protein